MFGRVFDTTTVDRVTGLIRPGLRLVTGEDVAVGRSHLGGLPRLDGTAPWPTHFETPLDLLAVIDVAELGPCDLPGLPAGTRFPNFFFLADRPELLWTSDEPASTWRVVPAGPDAKERTAPVERLVRPARPVGFVPVLTLPTWEDEVVARTLGVAEGPYPPSPRYHLIERYSAVTAAWNELVRDHLGAVHERRFGLELGRRRTTVLRDHRIPTAGRRAHRRLAGAAEFLTSWPGTRARASRRPPTDPPVQRSHLSPMSVRRR